MTRVLSELLGAREPLFSRSLQQLEVLSGHPQADIRLSSSVRQDTQAKLRELGLDGNDTTGRELYAALGERLKSDEQRFRAALSTSTGEAVDLTTQIAHVVNEHAGSRSCFAIRPTAAKRLLKANLPKKTMKALGYRSIDSMLKHESSATLYAAAWLIESPAWIRRVTQSYGKLQASDFESRELIVESPSSGRWQTLGQSVVARRKQAVLSFKELGAVVLLPLPEQHPPLAALTTTVLALRAVNEVRAAGTFMKLHQMQSNFGSIVQQVVADEPMLPTETLDESVSWYNLHQHFARCTSGLRADMFEPVVAASELAWTNVEQVIARIAPALGFWEQTAHLALMDAARGARQPVSCNLMDGLLSHCNALPYEQRLAQYFRQSLRSELLLNYLNHDKLEQTFIAGVHRKLAPEMAMI